MKFYTCLFLPLCLLLTTISPGSEELPTDFSNSPYWQKARRLMQQEAKGKPLSAEDRAFLDQSKQLRLELKKKMAGSRTKERPTRGDGTEGDNGGRIRTGIAPATLPEGTSDPVHITVSAPDGETRNAYYRKPPGDGPFPAIVFIHGGLGEMKKPIMQNQLTDGPVITRFLEKGYVTVMSTFRTYQDDIQSRAPIEDSLAAVKTTAKLPFVDPKRVAVYGGSGGGNIALELAGIAPVQAVIAGEPATVIYTGMLTTGDRGPRLEIMSDPEKYFTPELKDRTIEKLKMIEVPVLVLHSDQHDLIHLNREIFIPMMKQAGVDIQFNLYPGYPHGFYFGTGRADLKVVDAVVRDTIKFLQK
ncbi:MAG: prolyl oligopeptidase family serine peptidase [Verrucomicrobiales bacterium]|nr:prolyl oligopeptidase family serine peptidase [Verrucomicrobiales bacterium]